MSVYYEYVQITPHIFKMNLPFLGGRIPVGVWLVKDEAGWIMVDAGAPGFERQVLENTLAFTGKVKPRMLVLTHGHLDHAAAAQAIREQWRIPIAAGRDEIPFLIGPQRYSSLKPGASPLYPFLQLSGPALVGRNVQEPLDNGMQIGPLEVVHVPGHAPGQIALFHRADRALLCGDVYLNINSVLGNPIALFTYDMHLNTHSQEKLCELDFDHLLPSHGPAVLEVGRERAHMVIVKHRAEHGQLPTAVSA